MPKYSYRDATTHVLKGWGYAASNAPGDVLQEEADDFALEAGAWAWDGTAWMAHTPLAMPNITGFIAALQASMTLIEANDFYAQYPLFIPMLTDGTWAACDALVITAHTRTHIDDALYNTVRDAAVTYNVPLTLPAL